MATQRWKVPISIVAVNRIDHTDWLDIIWWMIWTTYHLMCWFSYVIQFFWFPNVWNEQMVIVTLHLHTLIAQFDSILWWIRILASSIPIRQHHWFTVNFTVLKEQELFFIWHLYEESNIFKQHIFGCENNHLFICAHW